MKKNWITVSFLKIFFYLFRNEQFLKIEVESTYKLLQTMHAHTDTYTKQFQVHEM